MLNEAERSKDPLRRRCELLESSLRCLPDGVVVVDLEGNFLFFSEAAERIVGIGPLNVSPDEWSSTYGCYLPDKVTPYPSEQLPLARAIRGEDVQEDEIFIRNAENPSGIWISVNSSPLYDEAGELCGGLIVFRDVTEHKESADLVRRLTQAVERTTDSVFITDANGVIEYVNPAFETTTGYGRDETLGRKPNLLKSGFQNRGFYESLWTKILGGEVYSGTPINRRKNGEFFHAEQTITPIRDEGDNITHFVSVMRDITEFKKAEARELEMRLARVVQQKLYPAQAPDLVGFDLAGATFPADVICGDYFDFIPMANGCLGVTVGDVSGHGVGSALLMAETRAYLRTLARATSDTVYILKQLNSFLCADTDENCYVTLVFVCFDLRKQNFTYASAGHISGYLLDSSGAVKQVLESTSLPLGLFTDVYFPSSQEIKPVPGDLLLLLTDGVPECQDGDENFFGDERALQIVAAQRQCEAREIINRLYKETQDFSAPIPQNDDITAVVCKVLSLP